MPLAFLRFAAVDPVFAADDDTLQREQRIDAYRKQEAEEARLDLVTVMSTVEGRRFVDMLRRDTGVLGQSYVKGDSRQTDFNEGRRSVGLELVHRLLHPDLIGLLAKMEHEHRDRIAERNRFVG